MCYLISASILQRCSKGEKSGHWERAGKGFPEEASFPAAQSPLIPHPCSGARGQSVSQGELDHSPLGLLLGRKEDHRDAAPSTVLEKPEWHECCSLYLSGAELWPARRMGATGRAGRAGRTPGHAAAVPGLPGSGASLPDPWQPPGGPGARSLPRWAARATASEVRIGLAFELLSGQPAPARTHLVSAGRAP